MTPEEKETAFNGLFEVFVLLGFWLALYLAFDGSPLQCLIPAYSIGVTCILLVRFGRTA